MVVKKDQLNVEKEREEINAFEKILFITLGSLTLGFLFITCWFLLTGDERIFLHGSKITPQHFCILFYVQSFFVGRKLDHESTNNSDVQQLLWAF
ncbi:MAG: hypothetical protein Q3M30_09930 [Candidatus Electrothrix sp. Rat3]|nr:hypothetical protein [Candidatus Electrothrix rattekaaiensis]